MKYIYSLLFFFRIIILFLLLFCLYYLLSSIINFLSFLLDENIVINISFFEIFFNLINLFPHIYFLNIYYILQIKRHNLKYKCELHFIYIYIYIYIYIHIIFITFYVISIIIQYLMKLT